MTADLLLRGGVLVLPGGPVAADLAVTDGVVSAIGEAAAAPGARRVVDVSGHHVLPGAVDVHVHFREPGFEHKEDFGSGSTAAVCGGVTTVCDMPNTHPPVTTAERFIAKRELAAARSRADFGLWAGGHDRVELVKMARLGAVGVKVFMNRSHRVDDPYAEELSIPDDRALRAVLGFCADSGLPAAVHVADHDREAAVRAELRATSRTDARLVCRSYRSAGVLAGLDRVLVAAADTGARVHVAHASLAPTAAVDRIAAARRRGVRVTAECGPPALLEDELDRLGVLGVPFAFPREDAELYWAALADGRIDVVATDHAPHTRADKAVGTRDVWDAPPGYPGVETSLPLMVDAVLSGRLSWTRLVELTSAAPARLCGLPGKGAIAAGADADLVLVDTRKTTTVDAARLHSRAGWSPYDGRVLAGRLVATYLRGHEVVRDGKPLPGPARGRFLTPDPTSSPEGT